MLLYTVVYIGILVMLLSRTTTIRLDTAIKEKLDSIKSFEEESYQKVIIRLINIAKDDEKISNEEIKQIEESLEDIKKGRVLSLKDAEAKWGI